jgi:menaquinone-dependent protoporphyrinogen oxidase
MAEILVLYGTGEGQTAKIAREMAELARGLNHRVTLIDGGHLPEDFSLGGYDAAIIGASVHVGRHQPYIRDFIVSRRAELDTLPTAFFSVSLSAASKIQSEREAAQRLLDEFLQELNWQPRQSATFAGALKYRRYGLIKRWFMWLISRSEGGGTDRSRDYEYTDWDAVASFTRTFLATLD